MRTNSEPKATFCLGTPEKQFASPLERRSETGGDSSWKSPSYSNQRFACLRRGNVFWSEPEISNAIPGAKPVINRDKKEAEQPQDLLGTHHQKCHRDRGFCTFGQPSHDQRSEYLRFPAPKTPSTSFRLRWSELSCCLCAALISGSCGGLPNRLPERRILFIVQKFRFLVLI